MDAFYREDLVQENRKWPDNKDGFFFSKLIRVQKKEREMTRKVLQCSPIGLGGSIVLELKLALSPGTC